MSTPAPERENELESPRSAEDESSWFDRLLQTFGLNDERDLRTLIESALLKSTSDALSPQERSMMLRILRFGTLTVEDSARFRPAGTVRDNGVPVTSVREGFQAGADLSNVNFIAANNSTIVEDESALHEWVGYIAVGLVITRLIWGLVGPKHARLSSFPPNMRGLMNA